jgi:LytS/YehU family sensor histidine kinase
VENAVKHSNDTVNLSYVRLDFSMVDDKLLFHCLNSKPLTPQKKNVFGGLGLTNIRRRLELLYDGKYSLNIREDEATYAVDLEMQLLLTTAELP